METKNCPACQSPLVYKSGVSKKSGKAYAFWGCSNFPACDYTEQTQKTQRTAQTPRATQPNNDVMNALRKIYELLDERLPKQGFPEPDEEQIFNEEEPMPEENVVNTSSIPF